MIITALSRFLGACLITLSVSVSVLADSVDAESAVSHRHTLYQVFDLMKTHVVTRENVDWPALKARLDARTGEIDEKALGQGIYMILEASDTGHAFYTSKHAPRFVMHRKFSCQADITAPSALPENVVYVRIDGFNSSDREKQRAFVQAIREKLSNHADGNIEGWIVDLRFNTGGNMWPMLTGVGPLLPDGTHGFFKSADGQLTPWGTFESRAVLNEQFTGGRNMRASHLSGKPIAVLSSRRTSSSGEAIMIAFKHKPNVRFFGEASCGMSTANRPFPLDNGARLLVTTGTMLDQNKTVYGGRVPVEVETQTPVEDALAWMNASESANSLQSQAFHGN